MGLIAVKGHLRNNVLDFSINANLRVAAFTELFKQFPVVTLSTPDQRREEVAFAAGVVAHHQIHNLGVVVPDHFQAGFRRYGAGALGIQQAQEVIHLRDGAHRGTGIVAGCLLLNGNDWAEAGDFLHFRLFQYAHEVLGIGGKGVHVTALALCIYGVKSQRAFAAAAESGYHHKLPPGNIHIDILQVIGPCAAYLDEILGHRLQRYEEFLIFAADMNTIWIVIPILTYVAVVRKK